MSGTESETAAARSLDRPMRYFLAKRAEGPALIVADRIDAIFNQLTDWPGESIYSGNRLAQPDEVINYLRGDGIE